MEIRRTSYEDYGMSEQEAREILLICRTPGFAFRGLVVSAAQRVNPYISQELVKSICDKESWIKQDVWIAENSFYGYRRRCLALLKPEFERLGLLKTVQENK